MDKFLIIISLYSIVVGVIFMIDNIRLENKTKDYKCDLQIEKELAEYYTKLSKELSKENQGYRKIVEKWRKEQDRLNEDD